MPRRQATFTEAEIVRAIRAAKKEGVSSVELRPDRSVRFTIERACRDDVSLDVDTDTPIVL